MPTCGTGKVAAFWATTDSTKTLKPGGFTAARSFFYDEYLSPAQSLPQRRLGLRMTKEAPNGAVFALS